MKHKIPTQLFLVTLLLGLSVAGWFFVDSCKQQSNVELVTIYGDTSLLEDRKLNVRYENLPDSDNLIRVSDLNVRFANDGSCESSFSIDSKQNSEKATYNMAELYVFPWRVDPPVGLLFSQFSERFENYSIEIYNSLQVSNIPPDTEDLGHIFDSRMIMIDGVAYFMVLNSTIGSSIHNDSGIPVDYTFDSGIWSLELTKKDAIPENIVPCPISSEPSSSNVYGLYVLDDNSTLALLTLENNTELYVTLYDTKTGKTHSPVKIFYNDSGTVVPYLMNYNDTCPMGSVYVTVSDGDEVKAYAISLNRNEQSGNIESSIFEMPVYVSISNDYDKYNTASHRSDFEFFNEVQYLSSPFVKHWQKTTEDELVYLDPELFFTGEDVWIISNECSTAGGMIIDGPDRTSLEFTRRVSEEETSFPDTSDILYHGTTNHPFVIQAYQGSTLMYEGILDVDTSFTYANPGIRESLYSGSMEKQLIWNGAHVFLELE
ncbi:MAG: hypothetical protein GXY06_01350 [Clostridiaceae bacterium]|nr:hypothetical protein [Clostridiaceae bacterium]